MEPGHVLKWEHCACKWTWGPLPHRGHPGWPGTQSEGPGVLIRRGLCYQTEKCYMALSDVIIARNNPARPFQLQVTKTQL